MDKLIEAAKALFNERRVWLANVAGQLGDSAGSHITWGDLSEREQEEYIAEAQAVLRAYGAI